MQKNMTALVSLFARAYHSENEETKVFDDTVARRILSDEEYGQISSSMAGGISFFNPGFEGSADEALKWIVNTNLAPTPLGRAAFAEDALKTAVLIGATQCLILASGYDSFASRKPEWAKNVRIFELDRPEMLADKCNRLQEAGLHGLQECDYIPVDFAADWADAVKANCAFSAQKTTFCSMLGLVYYLKKEDFARLISTLFNLIPEGSSLVFDYPNENTAADDKRAQLAKGANEQMQANYSYAEMEKLLSDKGFRIYEHLDADEIEQRFFKAYNAASPVKMVLPANVSYCLAVRK